MSADRHPARPLGRATRRPGGVGHGPYLTNGRWWCRRPVSGQHRRKCADSWRAAQSHLSRERL